MIKVASELYQCLNGNIQERYPIEFRTTGCRLFSKKQIALTKEISGLELQFNFNSSFPEDTLLEVKLYLPDYKKPIKIVAQVVSVEETRNPQIKEIRMYYLQINKDDREILHKYCKKMNSVKLERKYNFSA